MHTVSPFEANLLRILHGFLGRATLAQIQPLVLRGEQRPTCLSRDCVELVQDALAKGCVRMLATRGGWRQERFLRHAESVRGRLWERTAPTELGLSFSQNALDFLIWITSAKLDDPSPPEWRHRQDVRSTLGDRWLLFLAYETLRPIRELTPWLRRFSGHALCRLAYPQDFPPAPPPTPEQFARWTQGQGACILEVLQHDLAEHWIHAERAKGRILNDRDMLALGANQERTLAAFLASLEAAGRRDLARFLLAAAHRLLEGGPPASTWIAALDVRGLRMADRAEVYRAATAFLRLLETLSVWQRHARSVTFFDEDYAASQVWKSDWEHYDGDRLCERAHAIIQSLDPMQA